MLPGYALYTNNRCRPPIPNYISVKNRLIKITHFCLFVLWILGQSFGKFYNNISTVLFVLKCCSKSFVLILFFNAALCVYECVVNLYLAPEN